MEKFLLNIVLWILHILDHNPENVFWEGIDSDPLIERCFEISITIFTIPF